MTKSTITRERLEELAAGQSGFNLRISTLEESQQLARMALAAMDSESVELPLDYLQGHKDGLEWAAQLAEANHPETGDWLYDDPIDLAKAIRKGPDMPPVQPIADSEPFAYIIQDKYERERGVEGHLSRSHVSKYVSQEDINEHEITCTPLYRHAQPAPVGNEFIPKNLDRALGVLGMALPESKEEFNLQSERWIQRLIDRVIRYADEFKAQPAPVVPEEKPIPNTLSMYAVDAVAAIAEVKGWNACRAAMLAAAPQLPGSEPATVPGKWIPVSERVPESNGVYFGWDGKRVLEVNCFFGGFSANQFIHGEITHWMPLPAAPQEVNHG